MVQPPWHHESRLAICGFELYFFVIGMKRLGGGNQNHGVIEIEHVGHTGSLNRDVQDLHECRAI